MSPSPSIIHHFPFSQDVLQEILWVERNKPWLVLSFMFMLAIRYCCQIKGLENVDLDARGTLCWIIAFARLQTSGGNYQLLTSILSNVTDHQVQKQFHMIWIIPTDELIILPCFHRRPAFSAKTVFNACSKC